MKKITTVAVLILNLAFSLMVVASPVRAASFKPIELDPSYEHTKFAPDPEDCDIIYYYRAYTTCFDGPDDDNGDGTPDTWGIPHWVSYEIKKYPGNLPKGPKRPQQWITETELYSQGIAPSDKSYHFSKNGEEQMRTVPCSAMIEDICV